MPFGATAAAMPRSAAERGVGRRGGGARRASAPASAAAAAPAASRGRGGWRGPRRGRGRPPRRSTVTPFSRELVEDAGDRDLVAGDGLRREQEGVAGPQLEPHVASPARAGRVAARRSPWLPVASTSRCRRGTRVDVEHVERLRESRRAPRRRARSSAWCSSPGRARRPARPAARPASASVFSRATFEAKVVATTSPSASLHQRADRLDQRRLGAAGMGVEDVGRSRRPAP